MGQLYYVSRDLEELRRRAAIDRVQKVMQHYLEMLAL